jgi:perosamine synthetase
VEIPLSKVTITDGIKRRILEVVDSENFILGEECARFEEELASHSGRRHCILSSSWTAATHLLLIAMGIRPGDEILVPSHTAFPTIEPILHVGAVPVFVDIREDDYTLNPGLFESLLTTRTVGIMAVHLYGHPSRVDQIQSFCSKHGLFWIEDCAQAQGAKWRGKNIGSFGTHACFSFYPSKNLTVFGDGGCVATDNAAIAERVRMLRNHGRKDKYTHEFPGYNLRFNEIQAAVGREQLRTLDENVRLRRQVAAWYHENLSRVPGLLLPSEVDPATHAYHLFVVQLDDRDGAAAFLKKRGIATGIHYPVPNHRQPALNFLEKKTLLPKTEQAAARILSLPMHPHLSRSEVDMVSQTLIDFLKPPVRLSTKASEKLQSVPG